MLALIGAALLCVPALAGAAPSPYPPTTCSASNGGAGAGVGGDSSCGGVAPTSAHQNPAASTSPASHGTDNAGTASTGFQTLTATAIAAALLLGGAAFVVVGRRRRHG
ncbi:MAG TPA: LPXTG cell wall anchor domain-containing protein [Jatrophihabitans sp.]|nr:LPXTG cell wall anchor domain-containing protein [Jatrophihabitans sp.]